ncbi:DUF3750 domain-containing protein [Marinobacterium mangrovicola]|uniref:Uncharacterized protein DUF3750 n=1 Tax=Marinobacterium mangrovicola TaxID=1476959 RepID=A0A4R1GGA9_9GAMM|nr:DUF3750 domain-containing protein [Marinobacterium mangrovicola]TCK05695.1 uncharacterized protein DUF3750 [Marinobacterium mangrovicola]
MLKRISAIFLLAALVAGCSNDGWQTASRESAGIAPPASDTPEAVIQVYAADAWGWRGIFAVHTWIAIKPSNADSYTVHEVVGWRERRGLPVLRSVQDQPDRYWYGARPEVIYDLRGPEADELIPKIQSAVENYPWKDEYRVFPGPNSNTFPAWVGLQVPEMELDMPFRAIGSSWAD